MGCEGQVKGVDRVMFQDPIAGLEPIIWTTSPRLVSWRIVRVTGIDMIGGVVQRERGGESKNLFFASGFLC